MSHPGFMPPPPPLLPMPPSIVGACVPRVVGVTDMRKFPPDGMPIDHPAIETLAEFFGRIEPSVLPPACRTFNGSLCRNGDLRLLAYREEDWHGMNRIVMAQLDADYAVTATHPIALPPEKGVHFEDPRLALVDGRLILFCAHVRFGVPNVCRQRAWVLDAAGQRPEREITLPFGRTEPGTVEKNWMPFELPDGGLGIVYSQRPHVVIEVETRRGHTTPGLMGWKHGKLLSGRTPPLRVSPDYYLAFFGGHVKHDWRGTRYFIGAVLFATRPPFAIEAATPEALAWGSEASPTLVSSRPGSGHPLCLFPAGIAREGTEIIISCGVNDSYNALLKYSLPALLNGMVAVDKNGAFEP
jgi:predicted GH43/DUF377 family glycosyl hydrolase